MEMRVKACQIEGAITHVLEFPDDRFFYVYGASSTLMEGWYFWSREGVIGPYPSRSMADRLLKAYLRLCIACPEALRCRDQPDACAQPNDDT